MIANDFAFLDMVDWKRRRLAAGRSGVAGISQTPDMTKIRAAILRAQQAQPSQAAGGMMQWIKDNMLLVGAGALVVIGGVVFIRRRRAATA